MSSSRFFLNPILSIRMRGSQSATIKSLHDLWERLDEMAYRSPGQSCSCLRFLNSLP
jgi:hypothetical protein